MGFAPTKGALSTGGYDAACRHVACRDRSRLQHAIVTDPHGSERHGARTKYHPVSDDRQARTGTDILYGYTAANPAVTPYCTVRPDSSKHLSGNRMDDYQTGSYVANHAQIRTSQEQVEMPQQSRHQAPLMLEMVSRPAM
jgi:hypothetical protein